MFETIKYNGEPEQKKPKIDTEQYRVRHTDNIAEPDAVLYMNGVMIGSRKNLLAVTGKAKAGKTYLVSLIIRAMLGKGEYGSFSSYLPKGKDDLILIDTEQAKYHIHKVLNRIADLGVENKMHKLKCYSTRTVKKALRKEFVRQVLAENPKAGFIFIDGITDLISGVNNDEIAENLFDELNEWCEEFDVCIGYAIHQNPTESSKMRGHVGTVATNKCETALQVTTSKENNSVKVVDTTFTRNKQPEPFSFEILNNGMPEMMTETYTPPAAGRKPQKVLTDVERYSILLDVFTGDFEKNGIGYAVLIEKIREVHLSRFGNIGETRVKELAKYCKEIGWTVNDGAKTNYRLYPFEK